MGANVTTYSDTALSEGTIYYYRVRAFRSLDSQYSDYSNSANTMTKIVPPSTLQAVTVPDYHVNLSWKDNSTRETNFYIERSDDGVTAWTEIGSVAANATTLTDTDLLCGSTFYYRVRAYRSDLTLYSEYSNIASVITDTCPPATPGDFAVTNFSRRWINLSWTYDNLSGIAFLLEHSTDGSNWSILVQVPSATSYRHSGLVCGTTHYYRIRAWQTAGNAFSLYSPVINATTLTCGPLNPPTGLAAAPVSRAQINLSWTDGSLGETDRFHLERSDDGGTSWHEIARLPVPTTSYQDMWLSCGKSYSYRMRAYRTIDALYTAYTNPVTTGTEVCPTAVTNTTGVYLNGHWQFRDTNNTGDADLHFAYGPAQPGWAPLVGNWDGDMDGVDGVGVYKDGMWILRNSTSSGEHELSFVFNPLGQGALPVVGDWDGDGKDTVGVYKDGMFALRNSNSTGNYDYAFVFNPISTGAIPIAGDWLGSGIDTVGLYKDGTWYLHTSHTNATTGISFTYGPTQPGWTPLVGDWNQDGIDTIGLYRDGVWRLRNSNSAGAPDIGFGFSDGSEWEPVASYRGGIVGLKTLGLSNVWTPEITVTSEPTESPVTITPEVTESPIITETVTPTVVPEVTTEPPTDTPQPTDTPVPTATPLPTETPFPTMIPPTDPPVPEITDEPG